MRYIASPSKRFTQQISILKAWRRSAIKKHFILSQQVPNVFDQKAFFWLNKAINIELRSILGNTDGKGFYV